MLTTFSPCAAVAPLLICLTTLAPITAAEEGYRLPPPAVVKILDTPPTPSVSIDPTHRTMLLVERVTMPPIEDLARPMWRLAGQRVDPATNGPHGTRTYAGLTLQDIATGEQRVLSLPEDADISFPVWTSDGNRFAFTMKLHDGRQLWVGDVASASAKPLGVADLNATSGSPFAWAPDGTRLLCRLVPPDRGPAPEAPLVPKGPVIQESRGRMSPVRTYQDLLASPYDETRFEWIFTSTLAWVDAGTGKRTPVTEKAIWSRVSLSPDGQWLLLSRTVRPYSYMVPKSAFTEVVELRTNRGEKVKTLAELPVRDEVPIGGVATGPRGHGWCDSAAATLVWSEALDGGDPKREIAERDVIRMLVAPFDSAPRDLAKTEHRFSGIQWTEDPALAFLREFDRDRRWMRTWLVRIGAEDVAKRVIWDRSWNDRYGDPGRPVTVRNGFGRSVALVDSGRILLAGRGASPEGELPFLDRLDLPSNESERLWRCEPGSYESIVKVLARDGGTFITSHETPNDPPNYFVRDLASGARKQVTHFEDPFPELREIRKELVTYDREDGVALSATLYLPPDYEEGERLPLVVWAYPREFNDPATAGQVSGSPWRFTRIGGSSHLFFLTQGYAIMDGAAMPVIGDAETMNDTFLEQVVSSAKAAIDKAAAMGVADPERVGVGGHSYGAFMTANLLAHSDLFKAGVARSGAYNRTLTPFGFQSERRTFWEAPETYFTVSPFMHADDINEPILLIHGQKDNNSGTFPIQSERLYHAIKGHGGTVRLCFLPHESHGYRARESVMHTLAEMIAWFDEHVKGRDGT